MPASPSVRDELRHFAQTAAVAAASGAVLGLAGVPAGWLSGSVLGVAGVALSGGIMHVPRVVQLLALFTIGVSLGSVVTPETLRGISTWPISIVFLVIALTGMVAASAGYLRMVHGWPPLPALLASIPGAMSQVLVFSMQTGADLHRIVIVQTLRVAILTVAFPAALAVLGFTGGAGSLLRGATTFEPVQLAILVAVCAAVAALIMWVRFPGGPLFGAMVASAALHGAGLVETRLPNWILIVGMLALGAMTGARFTNADARSVLRSVGAGFGSFLVSVVVAAVFVAVLTAMFGFPLTNVAVAFAPGALDAMMILALALHLDPVYIGAHHLARFFFASLALPVLVRMYGGDQPDAAAAPTPRPLDSED